MRTGVCSIQQSLTPEAATIVKQAINLARRRGHAQVTPIHVASVMLASPAGLLRAACLKSHSHPLQCKALELCFNVALNRLPTTTPAPILGPHSHHYPALANALMAAFKRAQAHQRRGSIESQQQPILALKIETEQLVISILDDPSVSRVMREAGFSSTHVKSNVEQAVALLDQTTSQNTTTTTTDITNITPGASQYSFKMVANNQTLATPLNHHFELAFSKPYSHHQPARSEDVSSVMDSWVKRRDNKSSLVLVGECLGSCEGVVRGVKERVERGGGDVPSELRYVQFLNCPLLSMKNLSREEIDLKLREIRCMLKGFVGRSSGVVLYLGDLRWVAEYWAYYGEQRRHYYCPVEHLVMGLRRLVFGNVENGRIWLMGIATFNTFMKCKSGNPSLETLLDLHALTIPAGSLDLSLNLDSSLQGQKSSISADHGVTWPLIGENKMETRLTCCTDCSANCHREARSLADSFRNNESTTSTPTTSTSSSLPSWLQRCKEESRESSPTNIQEEGAHMKELCNKWNLICSTVHKSSPPSLFPAEKTINFTSSCSPSSSTSISSYEAKPSWFEPKWSSSSFKEHQFLIIEPKPELLSNPNSTPNSASSSEATEVPPFEKTPQNQFKVNSPENFETLCLALERKVPWQKDIIPEIASTILRCRAGAGAENKENIRAKQETWLLFLGLDEEGKLKVSRELAKIIFGSSSGFKSISLSCNFASTKGDSTDDSKPYNKRARDEPEQGYLERFAKEVMTNPHRVFYVEDVEQIDQFAQKGIRKAIEGGKITLSDGEQVSLQDAIVIFSCENFSSGSRACSPPVRQKVQEEKLYQCDDQKEDQFYETCSNLPLDLNIAVEDGIGNENSSIGDVRILDSVDKQIFFKIQML